MWEMDLSHDEKEETWRLLYRYLKDKPWQRSGDDMAKAEAVTALTHELASVRAELARVECEGDKALALLRAAFAYAQAQAVAESAANAGVVTPASLNMQIQLHDFITSHAGFDEE